MCLPINVSAIADGVGIKSIKWKCEVYMQKKSLLPIFCTLYCFLFLPLSEQPQSKMPRDRKGSRVIVVVVVYRIMEVRWEVKATAVGGQRREENEHKSSLMKTAEPFSNNRLLCASQP